MKKTEESELDKQLGSLEFILASVLKKREETYAPYVVDKLIKKLREYPEVLLHAAQMLEPYRLVESLREIAGVFHKFYALHRVVTENQELTTARLLLVDGVRIVLRNGLAALGVSHPEKM